MELLDVHTMQSKMSLLQCFVNSCVVPTNVCYLCRNVCYPCHNEEPKEMQISTDQAMTVVYEQHMTCHNTLYVTRFSMS